MSSNYSDSFDGFPCSSTEPSAYNTPSTTPTPTPAPTPTPPPNPKKDYSCKWDGCSEEAETSADLADHIINKHAQTQISEGVKKFLCLWDGCKVYNTPSSSQNWLLKHVLDHCGGKPFRCLFAGCSHSFKTHSGLERHVQSHLNAKEQSSPQQKPARNSYDSPGKVTKKKRSKHKRRLSVVKTDDFFDTGMVNLLHHKLIDFNMKTKVDTEGGQQNAIFHSKVIGQRKTKSGIEEVLLEWTPTNVLPNKWVKRKHLEKHKQCSVPLSKLPKDTAGFLYPGLTGRTSTKKQRRK